jgi:hypothetical protein
VQAPDLPAASHHPHPLHPSIQVLEARLTQRRSRHLSFRRPQVRLFVVIAASREFFVFTHLSGQALASRAHVGTITGFSRCELGANQSLRIKVLTHLQSVGCFVGPLRDKQGPIRTAQDFPASLTSLKSFICRLPAQQVTHTNSSSRERDGRSPQPPLA